MQGEIYGLRELSEELAEMCDAREIATNDILFGALAEFIREITREVAP